MKRKEKSLKDITEIIVDFSLKRGWTNENPNELIASLFIELGELAEHYQWKSRFEEWREEKKKEVGYEFVDVIFYLFRLAHSSGIDLEKCFDEKLPKLKKKFPENITNEEYDRIRKEYRDNGKNKFYE